MQEADSRIDVQYAVNTNAIPAAELLRCWADQALQGRHPAAELALRIVDEAEMTALNRQYRGKDGVTNVLSFPFEAMPGVETEQLGDIVICAPVVATEAVTQGKPIEAHWAHMVIHGVLHLLGHDHHHEAEAQEMESLEVRLLASLGFPDPYQPG
ncbi:MAG TPA: rRNA maturation RNase YbeY [Gammaproteobacteria bacterium]|nr:rRNA maturation RNase YbeY [Gammaproteobacteria bacterium]